MASSSGPALVAGRDGCLLPAGDGAPLRGRAASRLTRWISSSATVMLNVRVFHDGRVPYDPGPGTAAGFVDPVAGERVVREPNPANAATPPPPPPGDPARGGDVERIAVGSAYEPGPGVAAAVVASGRKRVGPLAIKPAPSSCTFRLNDGLTHADASDTEY